MKFYFSYLIQITVEVVESIIDYIAILRVCAFCVFENLIPQIGTAVAGDSLVCMPLTLLSTLSVSNYMIGSAG